MCGLVFPYDNPVSNYRGYTNARHAFSARDKTFSAGTC